MHGPVTIADLKREGKLLDIGCMACNFGHRGRALPALLSLCGA
jgi:hypothetical protein